MVPDGQTFFMPIIMNQGNGKSSPNLKIYKLYLFLVTDYSRPHPTTDNMDPTPGLIPANLINKYKGQGKVYSNISKKK